MSSLTIPSLVVASVFVTMMSDIGKGGKGKGRGKDVVCHSKCLHTVQLSSLALFGGAAPRRLVILFATVFALFLEQAGPEFIPDATIMVAGSLRETSCLSPIGSVYARALAAARDFVVGNVGDATTYNDPLHDIYALATADDVCCARGTSKYLSFDEMEDEAKEEDAEQPLQFVGTNDEQDQQVSDEVSFIQKNIVEILRHGNSVRYTIHDGFDNSGSLAVYNEENCVPEVILPPNLMLIRDDNGIANGSTMDSE